MKRIINLIIGLVFCAFITNAQPLSIDKDSLPHKSTIEVDVKTRPLDVKFQNTLESLTKEDINRIVNSIETKNKATNIVLYQLSGMLQSGMMFDNKVMYQAKKHYNMTEEDIHKAIVINKWILLFTYGIIFAFVVGLIVKAKMFKYSHNTILDIKIIGVQVLDFVLNVLIVWYVLRPILTLLINKNYMFLEFLIKGN